MGWLGKLKSGLNKSSSKISDGIGDIFTKKKLDDETLEELEELLITADLGASTSAQIIANFAKSKFNKEIDVDEVKNSLAEEITTILEPCARELVLDNAKPQIILMVGVNGSGKTTTLGKIAQKYKEDGKKVMIAACDTFRAAAVEQLKVWGERSGCEVITGANQADPASVAFNACEQAVNEGADVLLIDTAGRLQNKQGLMEELEKIVRVIKKIDDSYPHHTLLVLDATTGQNSNSQVKIFKEMVDVSGLIVTKLDGTAKGGVVVSLAKEFNLPIHAVGVGESIDDLQPFAANDFAKSLVGL